MGVQGRGEVAGSPAAEIRVVTTDATKIMGMVLHTLHMPALLRK